MNKKALRLGISLIKKGAYQKAIEILQPLTGDEEVGARALALQAHCHDRLGNASEALALYTDLSQRRTRDKAPTPPRQESLTASRKKERLSEAAALANASRCEEAIGLARPLVADEEFRREALIVQAQCHQRLGNLRVAHYLYSELVKNEPHNKGLARALSVVSASLESHVAQAKTAAPPRAPLALSVTLVPLGVVLICVGCIEFLRDLAEIYTTLSIARHWPWAVVSGITAILAGVCLAAVYCRESRQCERLLELAAQYARPHGQDRQCRSCGLRYATTDRACPFCAAPKVMSAIAARA